MARYCNLTRADKINNPWGRKTFVTTGIARMHLPAQRVPSKKVQNSKKFELGAMEVTLHRDEKQMRDGYCGKAGTDESRAATTRLMARYASGIKCIFDATPATEPPLSNSTL